MRPLCAVLVSLLLLVLAAPSLLAQVTSREAALVDSAAEVVVSFTGMAEKCIPPALLDEACAVAVFPDMLKAGFIVGGRHGKGVLLVREPSGGWGNPVFIALTGGSVGWQAGIQSTDLVLVFRTPKSVDRLLQGKGKLSLGADVAVAAGPVGREAAAGTDLRLKAEIYTYSRSRGLFAGVSLAGDGLRVDARANGRFYGRRDVEVADILMGRNIVLPEEALKLRATLDRHAGPR